MVVYKFWPSPGMKILYGACSEIPPIGYPVNFAGVSDESIFNLGWLGGMHKIYN